MLINAYDTTVGQQFRSTDKVESTIKTLHLTRNLTPTTKEGVFCITNENEIQIPIFAFPITLQGHDRKLITVYDERPFRNKSNAVVHSNEITISKVAAFLQHDAATGNLTPLKNGRLISTKAFSESVSYKLISRASLDVNETLTLKVLLAYFFISLQEEVYDDVTFIALNVIRTLYGTEKGYILGVVEELPRMATLIDLLHAIKANPTLYKLKSMDLKDLISIVGSISFSAMGLKIIAAAAEAPCLFTALVYGAARFKVYSKTQLGITLDPKYNKVILDSFILNIEYTYNLVG